MVSSPRGGNYRESFHRPRLYILRCSEAFAQRQSWFWVLYAKSAQVFVILPSTTCDYAHFLMGVQTSELAVGIIVYKKKISSSVAKHGSTIRYGMPQCLLQSTVRAFCEGTALWYAVWMCVLNILTYRTRQMPNMFRNDVCNSLTTLRTVSTMHCYASVNYLWNVFWLLTRGGALEDTFWSSWPWPRRSSPWP